MDLLKVCKDVRGAPDACRRTGPACQSAMGVDEVKAHSTACLLGFDSLLSGRGMSQWMIPSSNGLRGPQAIAQTPVKKLNTRMWWFQTAYHRLIISVCEHQGGRTRNVSSQHVAATVPCSSYSHKAVDIFHFRLVTLASKWVQQSWRAE
jgi:hypothetical protein